MSKTCPRLMAIDPSIRSLGWATAVMHNNVPHAAGHLKLDSNERWHVRASLMMEAILQITRDLQPDYVVVEAPNNWFTAKGQSSKDAEDVQKLYHMVGGICGTLQHGLNCMKGLWLVTPTAWKGQLPKAISQSRMLEYLSTHIDGTVPRMEGDTWDAIHLAHTAVKLADVTNEITGIRLPDDWTLVGGRMVSVVGSVTCRVDYEI